jgi:hypothetical protein
MVRNRLCVGAKVFNFQLFDSDSDISDQHQSSWPPLPLSWWSSLWSLASSPSLLHYLAILSPVITRIGSSRRKWIVTHRTIWSNIVYSLQLVPLLQRLSVLHIGIVWRTFQRVINYVIRTHRTSLDTIVSPSAAQSLRIIVLYRADCLATYSSLQIALATDVWFKLPTTSPSTSLPVTTAIPKAVPVSIDWDEFVTYVQRERSEWRELMNQLSLWQRALPPSISSPRSSSLSSSESMDDINDNNDDNDQNIFERKNISAPIPGHLKHHLSHHNHSAHIMVLEYEELAASSDVLNNTWLRVQQFLDVPCYSINELQQQKVSPLRLSERQNSPSIHQRIANSHDINELIRTQPDPYVHPHDGHDKHNQSTHAHQWRLHPSMFQLP